MIRAQEGDREAFTAVMDAAMERFVGTAQRILRERTLAEDAVQQAWLDIWRDLPTLRDPLRFEAWSYRVLVHACYTEARRAHHWMPNLPLDDVPEPAVPEGLGTVADRDQLEYGFRHLPMEQRAVVILHHYLGLPLASVAEVLGIPEGTVRSRLHVGMTRLRAALAPDTRPEVPVAMTGAVR